MMQSGQAMHLAHAETEGRAIPDCGGATILHLDSFEIPQAMSEEKKDLYSRRFLTLFMEEGQEEHRGGSGCVYRVFNARGETFALKRLAIEARHQLTSEERYARLVVGQKEAFRKEYESQQRLSGFKGFPALYGYGYLGGDPIILMEWIEGKTLKQARDELALEPKTRQLSPLLVAEIGIEAFGLLARMDYLDESFIHRDISPNNIMFRTRRSSVAKQAAEHDFDICLVDFGSSSSVAELESSFTVQSNLLRKATPEYAPPEMLTNDLPGLDAKRKSPSIDVYALASVLYELVAGHTPYRLSEHLEIQSHFRYKIEHAVPYAASVHELQSAAIIEREPDIAQCARECGKKGQGSYDEARFLESVAVVDAQLNAILQLCLSNDQGKRPTAAEAEEMLRAFRSNYLENVVRRYCSRELVPFASGKPNKPQRFALSPEPIDVTVLKPAAPPVAQVIVVRQQGAPREGSGASAAKKTVGIMTAAAVVCLAVSVATGVMFDGTLWSVQAFGIKHAGSLSGGALACLLAIPPLASLPFHWVGSTPGGKFLSGCIALAMLNAVAAGVLRVVDWGDPLALCCAGIAVILTSATMLVAFLCHFGFVARGGKT